MNKEVAIMGKHRTSNSNNFTTSDNAQNTSNSDNIRNTTVYCDPEYIVNDTYVEREVTYVHRIIRINRQHIVNVPRNVYRTVTRNVVIDPGIPDECDDCDNHKEHKKHKKNHGEER